MRLKTKLVLAITALVFLIAGLVSLVYVQPVAARRRAAVLRHQPMVAKQMWFALQNALETGLKDQHGRSQRSGPVAQPGGRGGARQRGAAGRGRSVNRYSLTVYDINIGDSQSHTLLSTNPENEDKPLPVRPNYKQLLNANSASVDERGLRPAQVFDVVVPLERNGQPFATVHVGVRTTLLRALCAVAAQRRSR